MFVPHACRVRIFEKYSDGNANRQWVVVYTEGNSQRDLNLVGVAVSRCALRNKSLLCTRVARSCHVSASDTPTSYYIDYHFASNKFHFLRTFLPFGLILLSCTCVCVCVCRIVRLAPSSALYFRSFIVILTRCVLIDTYFPRDSPRSFLLFVQVVNFSSDPIVSNLSSSVNIERVLNVSHDYVSRPSHRDSRRVELDLQNSKLNMIQNVESEGNANGRNRDFKCEFVT